jgi:hypothetical protein
MENEVREELKKTTKPELMQRYANRMNEIVKSYGGNLSDLPIDPDNEYYKIQSKLQILSKLVG